MPCVRPLHRQTPTNKHSITAFAFAFLLPHLNCTIRRPLGQSPTPSTVVPSRSAPATARPGGGKGQRSSTSLPRTFSSRGRERFGGEREREAFFEDKFNYLRLNLTYAVLFDIRGKGRRRSATSLPRTFSCRGRERVGGGLAEEGRCCFEDIYSSYL